MHDEHHVKNGCALCLSFPPLLVEFHFFCSTGASCFSLVTLPCRRISSPLIIVDKWHTSTTLHTLDQHCIEGQHVVLQFVATVTQNVEALTGSPVLVWLTNVISGSVVASTNVVFLDGNTTSAMTYQKVMGSVNTGSIFGSSFGPVTVDPSSVPITTVSNPSKPFTRASKAMHVSLVA